LKKNIFIIEFFSSSLISLVFWLKQRV
jgi:hypothetical protein